MGPLFIQTAHVSGPQACVAYVPLKRAAGTTIQVHRRLSLEWHESSPTPGPALLADDALRSPRVKWCCRGGRTVVCPKTVHLVTRQSTSARFRVGGFCRPFVSHNLCAVLWSLRVPGRGATRRALPCAGVRRDGTQLVQVSADRMPAAPASRMSRPRAPAAEAQPSAARRSASATPIRR